MPEATILANRIVQGVHDLDDEQLIPNLVRFLGTVRVDARPFYSNYDDELAYLSLQPGLPKLHNLEDLLKLAPK
jgi:hypothetical protein